MHLLSFLFLDFIQYPRPRVLDSTFWLSDVLSFGGGFVLVTVSGTFGFSFEGFIFLSLWLNSCHCWLYNDLFRIRNANIVIIHYYRLLFYKCTTDESDQYDIIKRYNNKLDQQHIEWRGWRSIPGNRSLNTTRKQIYGLSLVIMFMILPLTCLSTLEDLLSWRARQDAMLQLHLSRPVTQKELRISQCLNIESVSLINNQKLKSGRKKLNHLPLTW